MIDKAVVIDGLRAIRKFFEIGQPSQAITFDSYQNTIDDAVAMLNKQEIRWIPVTEKLPELNQRVLVYAIGKIDGFIGEHVIEICKRFVQRILPSSPGYETWSSPYQYFHTDYEITHWMPLPEPPKENDNEK